jgi:hypothetical protein
VSTSLFPGGSNLVSVARTNQFYVGGAFALGVVTVLRRSEQLRAEAA